MCSSDLTASSASRSATWRATRCCTVGHEAPDVLVDAQCHRPCGRIRVERECEQEVAPGEQEAEERSRDERIPAQRQNLEGANLNNDLYEYFRGVFEQKEETKKLKVELDKKGNTLHSHSPAGNYYARDIPDEFSHRDSCPKYHEYV